MNHGDRNLVFGILAVQMNFTGHDGAVCGLEFLPNSQRIVSGAS